MAFSSASGASIAEINITPLVDVMLVLLVIFMVTVPAVSHSQAMDLAQETRDAPPLPPQTIRIHVADSGTLEWNGTPLSLTEMQQRFAAAGLQATDPFRQPLVKIDADADAEYELVARVMARAGNAGLTRIALNDPAG